ncbi:MAG: O-antigen ligase family protein [Candidatus Sumerlaeaceae bacterium]|nr:O-antigen ligase family protein [Candidatus Sumerlaeaceae bacterium]
MATAVRNMPRRGVGHRRDQVGETEDFFTLDWLILGVTFVVMTMIFFLFTPYTHQLDEIKNVFLMTLPPLILFAAAYHVDFRRMSWKTHASTYLFGLYTLVILISYLLNPFKITTERVVWFQIGCSTFTVVFAWYMTSESKMRKVMMFYVLTALGSVLIGLFLRSGLDFTNDIYRFLASSPFGARNPEWVTLFYTLKEAKEMYSTILNADFYAAYLVMAIPISLSMFFVEEHLLFKVIAVVTFLLMNVCLALTNSNDSFLAMVILYGIYFAVGLIYIKEWGLTKKFILTFLTCGVLLVILTGTLMIPQLAAAWEFKKNAISGREILWGGAFWPWLYRDDFTKAHFDWTSVFFGTGPGGYRFYFPVFRGNNYFDNQINNVTTFGHSTYLDILCEFGAFGLLLFLAFHIRVLWDGFRQIRTSTNRAHQFYQLACFAGLSGVAVQNIFSPNNRWAVCGMIWWSLFGLSMGLYNLDNPGVDPEAPENRNRKGPMLAHWALMTLAALFAVRSIPQGFTYWRAAKLNGAGLQRMDKAERFRGSEKVALLEESRQLFASAIRYNPTFATAYYKMAHVLNQLGQTEEAIKAYEDLDKVFKDYSELRLNLGIMYSSKALSFTGAEKLAWMEKAWKEIQEAARQAIKPTAQRIAGHIGEELAKAYDEAGKQAEALAVRNKIKEYYWNVINYNPVLSEFQQDKKEWYPVAQQRLIDLANQTGNPREAEPVYKLMYEEDPDNQTVLGLLLAFYDSQKMAKEKNEFLKNAASLAITNLNVRKELAQSYLDLGDWDNFRRELRKIEAVDPKNLSALAGLYVYAAAKGTPEEAKSLKDKLREQGVDADKLTTGGLGDSASTSSLTLRKIEEEVVKLRATGAAAPAPPQPAPANAPTTAPPPAGNVQTLPAGSSGTVTGVVFPTTGSGEPAENH